MIQLVDETGAPAGMSEKLSAHEGEGLLHRAVSVLAFREDGGLILQRRAPEKYHFANRWANSSCSHPLGDETPEQAALRCLSTELGLRAELQEQFQFVYEARDPETGLIEREYDHVFVGVVNAWPNPDPDHVCEWRVLDASELGKEMLDEPDEFAPWLEEILCEASHRVVPSALLTHFGERWLASR